jgi:hypothetical protein
MQRIADEEGMRPRVLLEVNVSGEGTKIGFTPGNVKASMAALLEMGRLELEGLMTIPPLAPKAEDSRRYFRMLRELRDELQREFNVGLPHLSMGMSNDYAVAVEEGATLCAWERRSSEDGDGGAARTEDVAVNRQRVGDRVERRHRVVSPAGAAAARLSVRELRRRAGCHGQSRAAGSQLHAVEF